VEKSEKGVVVDPATNGCIIHLILNLGDPDLNVLKCLRIRSCSRLGWIWADSRFVEEEGWRTHMHSAIAHQEVECVFRVKLLHADIVEILAGPQASSIDGSSIEFPILCILSISVMTFRKGHCGAKMRVAGGMIFTHMITLLDPVSLGAPLSLPIACDSVGLECGGTWNESPFKNLFSYFWKRINVSKNQQVS
jgi:hypothetical protein